MKSHKALFLAPFFFYIFVKDISEYVNDCVLIQYADDKKNIHSGNINNLDQLISRVPVGLFGATVARSAHNREVPGSIPGRSGKIWAVFPIPHAPVHLAVSRCATSAKEL